MRSILPTTVTFTRFLAALVLLISSHSRATETVLLGDQFLDDERATQTLPRTAKWTYAGGPTGAARLWVTPPGGGGELRLIADGSNPEMALAYFKAAGAPQTLAAGESITLEFTAKLDTVKNAATNFRVALFNSAGAGNRPTGDVTNGVFQSNYANTHSGYIMGLNTGAVTAPFNLYERNNQGNTTPFAIGSALGGDNNATLDLKVKQAFPVLLKITRSTGAGTSVTVESTVKGVTVTRIDSSSVLTSFDGCGFYISGGALGDNEAVTVDNLKVKHTNAAATVTTTLLSDDFADNDRTNQALPGSAQWFYAGYGTATDQLTCAGMASAQNLVFTPGGVDAMALAYFTAAGSPQAMAVGDSITVQANVHLDVLANAADGIRFGLFNSGSVRAAADIEAGIDSSATFTNYTGYSVWLNPGASGGFNLERRGGAGANPFTPAANTLLGASNTASLALTTSVGMIPRFSMTLTRLSTGMLVEAAINGRNVVRIDAAPVTTSFDTFAFFVSSTGLYDGPQAVLSNVNVIHATAIPAITSFGKILSQTYEGTSWAGATFVGAQATGSVSAGSYGSIDVLGSVTPSGGEKLNVNSTGLTGYWSGALNSGLLAVANTETNLGKLTLAFDLLSSAVRPVRVRIESADAGGIVSGALERMIYPAGGNSFQRYAFELGDMTAAGGTFLPTAPNIKLTFQIEGGVDAGSWPAGNHSLQIDNVYYAKPAYYVKPTGNNSLDGRTEANAFATIAKALTAANKAGDIILLMDGPFAPSAMLSFSSGGVPGGWVTLKNYPGQSPLIQGNETNYDVLYIAKGFTGASFDYTTNLNYIEIRGLRVRGTADTLAVNLRGGNNPNSNVNGVAVNGRYMVKVPHHIRFADLEVYNMSAAGVAALDTDWWFVENCDIHDTSNWTIYGTSGISSLTPANFDGTAGTYRHYWLGNRVYRNETKEPWSAIGQISDGNGAILDTFLDTRHGPYLGRSIVSNNLFYENGGSGIHAYKVNGADIVNNTAVRNSHSPALTYANIFGNSSNDILIANNIIVASANEDINDASYSTTFPLTSGVTFLNNLYLSDGSTVAPYVGPNDSGNITTTDVKFVNDATGTNDYRLKTGSPAFDAGLALSVRPVRDFYGILRATDGLPDIGACERQPAIVTAPQAQTGVVGNSITLSVAAQSAGPDSGLSYQWQRNGVNVAGATSNPLVLTNLTAAQAGDYRALVSVGAVPFDTVTSAAATLTLWTQLQNWRNTNFGTINNLGLAADTADPDRDGIWNLAEYGLQLAPNTPALAGLPTSTRDGSGRLTLTFFRARTDVTYTVEGTTDFSSWETLATNPGTVGQMIPVTDTAPLPQNKRFLRLRITNP